MRKRKRGAELEVENTDSVTQEAAVSVAPKKSKKGEDALDKLLSLVSIEGSLVAGLTYLLTSVKNEKSGEQAVSKQLLPRYLEKFPDCEHILAPFGWSKEKRSIDVLLLCFELLEEVLLFTTSARVSSLGTSTIPYHGIGSKLAQTLISTHLRVFYSSLVTSVPMRLVASCLMVLVAMVMQGVDSAREIQQVFNFAYKPLEVFPSRTNTISGRADSVRLCFMNFALSFLVVGDADVIKTTLEMKGFLSSLFKLLPKDPPETILLFLTILDQKVVQDSTISKKTKSLFFNTYVLKQILLVLTTPTSHTLKDTTELQEYVYRLLLTLCTDFQLGVCYRSKAPPEGLQKTTNPVILHLLLSLTGSLPRPLVQTLVIKALTTCPDLIIPYLTALTMNFDPQPSSKWVASVEFVDKLFLLLPSLKTLLSAESAELPLSYLNVGVGLTAPTVLSRSSLSHGIQHPLLLVKFHTLSLVKVALRRAADFIGTAVPTRSLATIQSFLILYCDRILKCLPDVKTLIALHQQLLSGGVSSGCGLDTDKLDSSDQLRNAELQESPDLLSLSVEVLRGYQTLCPTIFVQAGYNLTKLLPSSPESAGRGSEPAVLVPTLQLLTEAPVTSIKWSQKGGLALKSVLMLLSSSSEEVAKMAASLSHKLLISMEMFQGCEHELTLLLLTLREFCAPQAVEFVVRAVLEAAKGETGARAKRRGASNSLDAGEEGDAAMNDYPSLEDLLASPLVIPDALLSCDSHVTDHKEDHRDKVFPLLASILSNETSDSNELERFKGSFLRRLLLIDSSVASHVSRLPSLFNTAETENGSCVGLLASCLGEDLDLSVSEEMKERLRQKWRGLSVADEDFTCSLQAVSNLLWHLFGNDVDDSPLVQFLFDMLSEAVPKMNTVNGGMTPLLSDLVESLLIRDTFLHDKLFEIPKLKRKRVENPSWESNASLFSGCIGQLLSSALHCFPSVCSSPGFQSARDKLLAAISEHVKSPPTPPIGALLCKLLCDLRMSIDKDMAAQFCQSLLSSHRDVHKDSISFLSSVLTILIDVETTLCEGMECEFTSTLEEATSRVCLSEQAVESLVKLAAKSENGVLDRIVLLVLKQHCCKHADSVNTILPQSEDTRKVEDIASSVNSAVTSLLSLQIDDSSSSRLTRPAALKCDVAVARLLASPSDTPHSGDKLNKIYSCLTASCAQNTRARRVLEFHQLFPSHRPSSHETLPLSEKVQKKLLNHCVRHVSQISADISSLLFQFSDFSFSYFEAELLCKLCDKLTIEEDCMAESDDSVTSPNGGERVCVLRVLLSYLVHLEKKGESGEDDEGHFETAAKTLWRICSTLLASSDCDETQGACSAMLRVISMKISKGQRKAEKLLRRWIKSDKDWSHSQLSLALSFSLNLSYLSATVLERSLHMLGKMFLSKKRESVEREEKLLEETKQFTEDFWQSACESGPDAEIVSQFIHTALKCRFTSPSALSLLVQLIRLLYKCRHKETKDEFDIDMMYERVWSHSKFLPVMCQSHDQDNSHMTVILKERVVELLVTMVEARPSLGNTSHVPLLLGAYSATRNKSDRGILYLLFKYEEAGVSFEKHRPFLWGPSAVERYKQKLEVGWLLWKEPGMQEVVGQLKREMMLESTQHFPLETDLNPINPFSGGCGYKENPQLYDPCFLLPLLVQLLDPSNLVDCRRFIDSGCLGYLIASLSSSVESVRNLGGCGLELFVSHLDGSWFREKSQVSLLLEVLKNSLSEKNVWLPSIFSAFFRTTASLLLHAESSLYSAVTRFLVYKPALDLGEIPLFMTMLQSSSVEHQHERGWILHLLVDGLRCKEDYSLYRRKRVFDHCLSLLGTGIARKHSQALILELVLRGVAIPEVAADLVVNKGLITSLELVKTFL